MRSRSLFLALILALAIARTGAQSSPDSPEGKTSMFAQQLLRAMSHRDIDALAAMMHFPVSVHAGSVTVPIADRTALAKAYDTVFTPELGCAIERSHSGAAGRDQGDTTGREGGGLSLAHGAVHLQSSGTSLQITRIEEPTGAAPPAPRPHPRQVNLPSGQVQFAGTLAAAGADRYIVAVRPGDVLQARIERFQGPAIGVRVVDAKSNRTLSNGADSARVVSASAPQAGDVTVEVTRLTFCDPAVSYLLTISKHR